MQVGGGAYNNRLFFETKFHDTIAPLTVLSVRFVIFLYITDVDDIYFHLQVKVLPNSVRPKCQ